MSNDTSKEKLMRQKITYIGLPTKGISEFMACGPVMVHTLSSSTKEVEALFEFEASLVYKVIPGLFKKKKKKKDSISEGKKWMPERKWQSKRFTYVCIHVHWKQKPGSHAYKVRTESEQHHLKIKQIDGNGSVQPNIYSLVFFLFFHFSDIVSHVVLPVLELTLQTRLALNSDPTVFASRVLGLKVCAATAWHVQFFSSSYSLHTNPIR